MFFYRICPELYLTNFSGVGASFERGARWNFAGSPVIYFTLSASVAMLEMANYIASPNLVPKSFKLGKFYIPNPKVNEINVKDLPKDWNSYPYTRVTQEIGSAWLEKKNAHILLVPSTTVPGGLEKNAVFNPLCTLGNKSLELVEVHHKIYSDRMFMDK